MRLRVFGAVVAAVELLLGVQSVDAGVEWGC